MPKFPERFVCGDGTALHVHCWRVAEPRWVCLCVQGLGGHGGYYAALFDDLADTQPCVIAPDLRGHGHSQGTRGDIEDFNIYVADVKLLTEAVQKAYPKLPVVMLGESMGTTIVLHYLGQHQPPLQGSILMSPALKPTVMPRMQEVFTFLRHALFNRKQAVMGLRGREDLGARDEAFNDQLRQDKLFIEKASIRFLTKLNFFIMGARKQVIRQMPVLILVGEDDRVTDHRATLALFENLDKSQRTLVEFPTAFHALLHDPVKPQVLMALKSWLSDKVLKYG